MPTHEWLTALMTMSVLLVGYGLAGRVFHAPLISAVPALDLRGIVTSNAERSVQAHQDHPNAEIYSSLDEALTTSFDLVVIATANVTHVPFAELALSAGAHVVVDKPLAADADQAQALADLAASRGLLAVPFQNRRWDSDFLTARRVVESGALGFVHRFESRIDRMRVVPKQGWRGSPDPADLGGMLYDLGSHLVDQSLALMGPAVQVAATVRSVRPLDPTDDDVTLLLTHESGAISVLTASQISAFPGPRMTVLGTHGGLRIDASDTQEDILRTGIVPSLDWGVEPETSAATLRTFDDDNRATESRMPLEHGNWPNFYRCLAAAMSGESAAPVSMTDAVATLRVLDAARVSGATGTTVGLNPPAGHAPAN
jgi:scyllo-inositol 2-dehydrogenase (NADP+)